MTIWPRLSTLPLLFALAAPAAGQDPTATPSPTPPAAADRDGRRTLRQLPLNLLRGTVGLFSRDGFRPLLLGAGATFLASELDDDVRDRISDPNDSFATSFESIGDPLRNGVAVAGLFAASRLSDNAKFRALSYDLLDGFIVNWAYTTALKKTIHRERPNGEDNTSFPSGHASNAFVLATVVERHLNWKAALPAYLYASAVAASRLQRNKHYLSDVLGGAAVGYLVGRSVVRVNRAPGPGARSSQLSVVPMIGPDLRGVSFALTF